MQRAEIGLHHHFAGAEGRAWRKDHRRVDNWRQVMAVSDLAMAAPTSMDWCGDWQRARP
jgi:hypothetical protein